MSDDFSLLSTLPVWRTMGRISLDEMDSIRLMNRIDTKFVTSVGKLVEILREAAIQGYRACEIEGQVITRYYSVYYDTPELRMYTAHETGRKVRQKIRVRTYLISGDTYLEVKNKNNHGRTKKKRIALPEDERMDFSADTAASEWLQGHSWYTATEIRPTCTTEFNRITLVNGAKTERLTIDFDLHFHNFTTRLNADLGDAVIIELKQDGRAASQMKEILRSRGIRPYSASKYCLGVALTDPGVRSGRLKGKIHHISKQIQRQITRYESSIR